MSDVEAELPIIPSATIAPSKTKHIAECARHVLKLQTVDSREREEYSQGETDV